MRFVTSLRNAKVSSVAFSMVTSIFGIIFLADGWLHRLALKRLFPKSRETGLSEAGTRVLNPNIRVEAYRGLAAVWPQPRRLSHVPIMRHPRNTAIQYR